MDNVTVPADECDVPLTIPSSVEFLEGMTTSQTVLLSMGSALSLGIIILGLIHVYFIYNYVSGERKRTKMYFIAALYPFMSALCVTGMFSPRSAPIMTSLGMLTILWNIYMVITLKREVYPSREEFVDALIDANQFISARSPPFCCCCSCLPRYIPSIKNVKFVERMVLQAVVIRADIEFVCIYLLAEFGQASATYITWIDFAGVPSLLVCIYGGYIMNITTTEYLDAHRMTALFRFVDTTLPLFQAQFPLIFELIFVKLGFFSCGPMLSMADNARFVFFFVMICELFLMSLLASYMLTPEKCAFFDNYHKGKRIPTNSTTEMSLIKDSA